MKSFVGSKIIEVFKTNMDGTFINQDYIDMKQEKLKDMDDRQALDWADVNLDQKNFMCLLEKLFPLKMESIDD